MKKVSPVFYVLLAIVIASAIGAATEDHDSGWRAAGIIAAGIGVLAAGYNRWHNGSWLGDFSGGK